MSQSNLASTAVSIMIPIQPIDIVCRVGDSVNISAAVRCHIPSFQWYNQFGKRIPKQNKSNLFCKSVKAEDFGFYKLEIID